MNLEMVPSTWKHYLVDALRRKLMLPNMVDWLRDVKIPKA
jgi:hypothetical protein